MNIANRTVFFLLSACVIVSTLAYGTVHQPTISLFYFVVAAMLILWALDSFLSGSVRYSRSLLQAPLYAVAIYAFVQIIAFGSTTDAAGLAVPRTISLEPFATQMTGLHLFSLSVILSLSLIYVDSAKRLQKMVYMVAIFGFAYAFYAILQALLSPTRIYGIYERPTPFGSFVNRHNYAAFMEMAMAIPLGLIFAGAVKRDKILLYITAVSLMGISLLLSGSRGGLVAILAEVFLLLLLTIRTRGVKKIALRVVLSVLLIGVVIGGAVVVGGETGISRFAETLNSKDVTTDRTHIWSVTLKVISANLPFGAGLGAFGQAYTPYDDFNGLERVEQAHNDYLQVLADAGLVGALIGGVFLVLLFLSARKSIASDNIFRRGVAIGAISGIFAILVHSLFDFVIHTTAISILFILLIALLVAAGREYADDIQEVDSSKHRRRRSSSRSTVATFEKKKSLNALEGNSD